MIARLGWGWAVLGMVSLAFSSGCDRPPPRVYGPDYKPSAEAAKAMELFDTNKDGKIAGTELDKSPGLLASLKVMGTDRERGVTPDHIKQRAEKWLESKIGRMNINCQVLRNNQPLVGATVKFVPEPFLTDALDKTPEGTTSPTGMAMVSLPTTPGPDGDPAGMAPGIYRVEVTKSGESIPAQYNTATTLGQEVSLDNPDIQLGIKFNLKY
ncbi:MAG: hypothetical protein IT426_00300 [Pirellulales bacterium]|nr:hypothetical protein [Pirellulales bacterium]